jgi:ribonucleoside-diphosphate reductase alpha chain
MRALLRSRPGGGTFHIEDVQDQVELGLMRGGHHEMARAYVLYRERRTQERARQADQAKRPAGRRCCTCIDGGQRVPLDLASAARPDRISLRQSWVPTSSAPHPGRDHAQPV